jgi:hypothetical protein
MATVHALPLKQNAVLKGNICTGYGQIRETFGNPKHHVGFISGIGAINFMIQKADIGVAKTVLV